MYQEHSFTIHTAGAANILGHAGERPTYRQTTLQDLRPFLVSAFDLPLNLTCLVGLSAPHINCFLAASKGRQCAQGLGLYKAYKDPMRPVGRLKDSTRVYPGGAGVSRNP